MAKLRVAVSETAANERLSRRGPDAWLTAAEVQSMRDLIAEAENETDTFARAKLRQAAYRLCDAAWGFSGSLTDLLGVWAEDRREAACRAWVRAKPGRSMKPFEPFENDRFDLL